ncbi:MAG: RAMP superfamily CRISPR-associated protein [Campylobacterales bacterium]
MKTIRYLAKITLQSKTPLKVSSGHSDFFTDSPIQKDVNRLPMILGTSITGVLRDRFRKVLENKENEIFGFQKDKENEGQGSNLIVSNALLCNKNGEVVEGIGFEENGFIENYLNLPLREHTAINSRGVANKGAKFDEEVVYKGSRFTFELELVSDGINHQEWNKILYSIQEDDFRLGGGTTKGFGSFESVEIKTRALNLEDDSELEEYINKSSSLNDGRFQWKDFKQDDDNLYKSNFTKYTLTIEPDDFFMFGSGFGDKDADNTPKKEQIVVWENQQGEFVDEVVLIPASSIKGALAHRTAFYYNKAKNIFADKIKAGEHGNHLGENNEAVKAIFGHKKEIASDKKTELGQKGKILISDCFKKDSSKEKVFDHVAIDRFTGGAMDGALFQEKTIARDDENYEIEILLDSSLKDTEYEKAFECALTDITTGMLPLGGATTKGHGVFCGELRKNAQILKERNCYAL